MAGQAGNPVPRPRTSSPHPPAKRPRKVPGLHRRLAAALAPIRQRNQGSLTVGVIDLTTGVAATYHGRMSFDTASIIKADILAVLLLQHQHAGTALSPTEQQLAADMIEDSDNDAATDLWDAVEGPSGMEAGDATLGLRHTVPGPGGYWGLTTTTAGDQLRLLTDLTSPRSPLRPAARHYELGLMQHVEADQDWGATAPADEHTRCAVKNGWLPLGPDQEWIINSIAVIRHAGHRILIAVLSSGQPSESAGIRQAEAVATAAVSAVTAAR